MSPRDKTRARRSAERRRPRAGTSAHDGAVLRLAATPTPVSHSGSRLINGFRQGTASASSRLRSREFDELRRSPVLEPDSFSREVLARNCRKLLMQDFRQGTASHSTEGWRIVGGRSFSSDITLAFSSGVLTPEAAGFLIANPRLETDLTTYRINTRTIPNSEKAGVLQTRLLALLPGARHFVHHTLRPFLPCTSALGRRA
jgi:hypothetical protein